MSRSSEPAAARLSGICCGSMPVKNTSRTNGPTGTWASRYVPDSSVKATRSVPFTETRALFRYWPVTLFWTRPEMLTVWWEVAPTAALAWAWAERAGMAKAATQASKYAPRRDARGNWGWDIFMGWKSI